jgi:hypothetical protein
LEILYLEVGPTDLANKVGFVLLAYNMERSKI